MESQASEQSYYEDNHYPQEQYVPIISIKEWLITILIMAIPIVNIVMMFVWAFGGGANPSKANYFKASLIWIAIIIGIYIIFAILLFSVFARFA